MQINTGNLQAFNRDLKKMFKDGLETVERPYKVEDIADIEDGVMQEIGEFFWAETDETMRNWTGRAKEIANILLRGFEIANQDFERTFGIPLKVLERNEGRRVRSVMDALIVPARMWLYMLVEQALQNGGFCNDAAGVAIPYTWLDGKAYFATDHLSNVSDPLSPIFSNLHAGLALSADSVTTVRGRMMTLPGIGKGAVRGIQPKQLWVPPTSMKTAMQIATAKTLEAGGENVLTVFGLRLVEIPTLAAGSWYLAGTRNGRKPILVQREKAPRFASNAGDLANRFDGVIDGDLLLTEEVKVGASARGAVALVLPDCLHKATA